MTHPLSKRQKAVLSQLSTRAWHWCGREMGYDSPDAYRHAAVAQVTGGVAGGLRACTQAHYVPLYNYFAGVVGAQPIADRTPRSEWDKALYLLNDALARYDLPVSYAAAIIRARCGYGEELSFSALTARLSPEELRQVTYTVINRGRARVRREAAALDLPLPTEPHASPSTLPPGRLAAHFGAHLIH